MELGLAIESGKEKRKLYRGEKAICKACCNYGSDDWDLSHRVYRYKKCAVSAEQQEKEFSSKIEKLEYKGYYGTVEFSEFDNIYFGKVIGINGLISFEGDSIQSLQEDFKGAVDDYLGMCKA